MFTKTLRLFFILIFVINAAFSQSGKITGKVINIKTGEPLIGATILLEGKSKAARSDLNGYYSIAGLSEGSYSIVCSYVSYTTRTISGIKVQGKEATVLDIVMEQGGNKLDAVVIKSTASSKAKETINSLIIAQKNSANVSDGISAETIKKTPDKNTSDILKRVSGASIQEDKFVIIRGLNDRYNASFINGAPLPSTESDRKAFSFDIFPANMLDNLIIYKTATPDLPGEFAGGTILINTKDIPAKSFQSFTFGLGANTLTTLKESKYANGGHWDYLGFDDGTRALPANIPGTDSFPQPASLNPNLGRSLKNQWVVRSDKTFPNINVQYVIGLNFQRHQKDFIGTLFSLSYNRWFNNTEGINREHQEAALGDTSGVKTQFTQKVYSSYALLGFLANFSLKVNDRNTFSFKNIFSINAEDKIITREGYADLSETDPLFSKGNALWFTSNKILSSQLLGDHYLSKSKIRINWLFSYSGVRRSIPDLRTMIYTKRDSDSTFQAAISDNVTTNGNGGGIYYSALKEDTKNFKIDIQRTFKMGNSVSTLFKMGAYLQSRNRDYGQRNLGMIKYNQGTIYFDNKLLFLPQDKIFDPKNIGQLKNGKGGFILAEDKNPSNNYTATTDLYAGYAMLDQRFFNFLRMIYGVRLESYNIKLYLPLGQGISDTVNRTVKDLLPSANLIFSINKKQNLRLSYSKTLNRPEFRELAPAKFYDFATRYVTNGDTAVQRATIDNFDLRYEIYPGRGQLLTLSAFYKKFKDPIEQATAPDKDHEAAYFNVIDARNKGIELEFRTLIGTFFKKLPENHLLNKLTVFSNISFIKSTVTAKKANDTSIINDRPLQGQSPYVFNAGVTYQDNDKGWSSTIVANRVGQRIFIVGNLKEADVWENGRTVIDFQVSKIFFKNFEAKLNIRDLLAQKLIFFEDTNNDKKYKSGEDYVRWYRTYPRVISLTLTYKF